MYLTTTAHRNHCGRNSEIYGEIAVSHMARCLTPGAHLAHTGRKAPAVEHFDWLPVGAASTKTGRGSVSLI